MSSKAMPLTTHEQRDELAALLTSTGAKDLPTLQSTIGNQAMARMLKLIRGMGGESEGPTGGSEEEEEESTERLQHKDEEERVAEVLRDGELRTPDAGIGTTTADGGATAAATPATPTFPNIATIKAAAPVTTAIEADWTASESDYNERAAWVMWDSANNTFSVVGKATGTWEACTPTPKPPDSGTNYHVGHYHIHPQLPPAQQKNTANWPVAPSTADRNFATTKNSPGFVKDYKNTARKKGDEIYYDYGPAVRA